MNLTADNMSMFEINRLFCPEKLYIDRYLSLLWFAVGLPGNLLATVIWSQRRMRRQNSSAVYLTVLSINDFVVLIYVLFIDLNNSWNIPVIRYFWCNINFMIGSCAQLFSPVLVLAFTIERWIAICYPFKRHLLCSPRRAVAVSIVLFLVVLGYNFVIGFLWVYDPNKDNCVYKPLYGNVTFEATFYVASEIIFSFTVPLLILCFNILVLRELYRVTKVKGPETVIIKSIPSTDDVGGGGGDNITHKTSDRSFLFTTFMLLAVSFYLMVTTLPVGIMFTIQHFIQMPDEKILLSELPEDPRWKLYFRINIIKAIVDELCISHYALNIFIYLSTGQGFRQTFMYNLHLLFIRTNLTSLCQPTASMLATNSVYSRSNLNYNGNKLPNSVDQHCIIANDTLLTTYNTLPAPAPTSRRLNKVSERSKKR